MKLIYCKHCEDIVRLILKPRTCECGKVGGQYLNDYEATYFGNQAIPLGFDNGTFSTALDKQPTIGLGREFKAFVIPKACYTMKKVKEE